LISSPTAACPKSDLWIKAGIQVGGYIENRGKDLFTLAKENGLEGIIAKGKASICRPGKRSHD